jgi:hypothetical protein
MLDPKPIQFKVFQFDFSPIFPVPFQKIDENGILAVYILKISHE